MSAQYEKLEADVLTLPKEERAHLVEILLESLDDARDEDVDAAWLEEIRRRDAEIRAGTVKLRPAEEVLREIHEQLRCKR